MAIFHLNAKVISRAQGRSATGACAYRAGQKIKDERTGLVFNYTRKKEVVYRHIFAPVNAPDWVHDRASLWNQAEHKETRKDAQVAREIEVSLPVELNLLQQTQLLESFVQAQFVRLGMVADVCIHDKPGNPHAHILLTTREITPSGFGAKNRDWNTREQLEKWRSAWATHANHRLMFSGFKTRIDSRSLQAQGIDRVPTVHIGPTGTAIQAKGLPAAAMQLNQKIKEINMNEIKNKPTPSNSKLSKAALRFLNAICMPLSTSNSAKQEADLGAFALGYLDQLEELFEEWIYSIQYQNTDTGRCIQVYLEPGSIRDFGGTLSCQSGTDKEITAMLMVAKMKGWSGIHLTGSDQFKEKAFLTAVLNGLFTPAQITGYILSPRAIEVLTITGKWPMNNQTNTAGKNTDEQAQTKQESRKPRM